MNDWKDYNIEKPNKSDIYKIKAKAPYETIDAAYYNAHDDRWIEDDGWWLPVDITSSVTHWR